MTETELLQSIDVKLDTLISLIQSQQYNLDYIYQVIGQMQLIVFLTMFATAGILGLLYIRR